MEIDVAPIPEETPSDIASEDNVARAPPEVVPGIGEARSATILLTLDCRKCNMKFKKREELSNHLSYFCQDSKYANIELFKRTLLNGSASGSTQQAGMSFETVRDFINGGAGAVGNVSLSDMRKHIRGDATAMAEVKAEVLKSREKELLANLRSLKTQHSDVMFKRMEEESRIQVMIGDLDAQRTSEIRSRIEKERVKHVLKRVDQANLQALEAEKRHEIQELVKEQAMLKKKEGDALEEIDKLVRLIETDNVKVVAGGKSTAAATAPGAAGNVEDIRQKFASSGRLLGEEAAAVRFARERLVKERENIVAKLGQITAQTKIDAVGQVDINRKALDDRQRHALIDKLKADQSSEMTRLETLREKLNAVRSDQERVLASQDAEIDRLLGADNEYDNASSSSYVPQSMVVDYDAAPTMTATASFASPNMPSMLSRDSVAESAQHGSAHHDDITPLPVHHSRQMSTASSVSPTKRDRKSPRSPRAPPPPSVVDSDEEDVKRDDAGDSDGNKSFRDEALLQEIKKLKRDLADARRERSVSPTRDAQSSPIRDDYYGGGGDSVLGAASPLLTQLQQQMTQTQLILQQHQSENARLQQELGDIEMSNEVQRLDRQRRDFENTLRLMTAKLTTQAGLPIIDPSDAPPRQRRQATFFGGGGVVDRGGGNDLDGNGFDLSQLPKDSELYKIELEHRTRLAKLRFQREITAEEQDLANFKQEGTNKARELEEKLKHDRFMSEQMRELEKQRLRQEMARDLPLNEFVIPSKRGYNAFDGFTVLWDFIYGLERTHPAIKIIYQVLDNGSPKVELGQSAIMETEPDGPPSASNRRCIAGFVSHFPRLPPLRSLKLLVEVQNVLAPPSGPNQVARVATIGWSIFDLFIDDSRLASGLWKSRLYTGPIRKDGSPSSLAATLVQYRHPSAEIYLRLLTPREVDNDKFRTGGDPNLVMQYYRDQSVSDLAPAADGLAPTMMQSAAPGAEMNTTTPNARPQLEHIASLANIAAKLVAAVPATTPTTVTTPAADTVKAVASVEVPIRDVGFVVRICEYAEGVPFVRVRVSLYLKGVVAVSPVTTSSWQWTSPYAQIGVGGLGQFEWEKTGMFPRCPIEQGLQLLFELVGLADKPPDAPPTFELQGSEAVSAYAVVDVVRNGGVNLGPAVASLANVPIAWPFHPSSSLVDAALRVELFDPAHPPIVKDKVNLMVDAADMASLPWVKCVAPPLPDVQFEPGDGFDVYVDAARFLPDNITVTRVTINVWTSDFGTNVGERVGGICAPDSAMQSPRFDLRAEYRANNFNPTCTIEVTVQTIEEGSRMIKLVGTSVLNAFVVKGTLLQPTESQAQEFNLNQGSFQLPLHVDLVRGGKEAFFVSSYDKVPTLPCATVLVRILPARKSKELGEVLSTKNKSAAELEALGLLVKPLPYNKGNYDSTRCVPDKVENKFYNIRDHDEVVLVSSALNEIGDDYEKMEQETESVVRAWIEEKFVKLQPAATARTATPQRIDLRKFAKYNQGMGVRVSIDAAYNVGDGKLLPFVIYSNSPPGDFYKKDCELTDEVQLTGIWDWDSLIMSPTFLNGYTLFKDVPFDEHTVMVIDVRLVKRIDATNATIEPFGWTVVSLFSSDGYVSMGAFQLALFKGVPDSAILEMMTKEDVSVVITRETQGAFNKKRKAAKQAPFEFAEPASVVVRVIDAQLGDQLGPAKFSWRLTKLMHAEFERRERYEYDADAAAKPKFFGLGGKPQKLVSLLKAGGAPDDNVKAFEATTLKLIASKLGIGHLS